MRAVLVTVLAVLLLGCVRETVSCVVLAPDDPLCQDPDANVDADVDATVDDSGTDAGLDAGG